MQTKLRSADKVAYWVAQNIWYTTEKVNVLRSVEDVLARKDENGDQYGNCSEISVVAKFGLNQLMGYKSENFIIYGIDKGGERSAHAVAAFTDGVQKGFISGRADGLQVYPGRTPWAEIAEDVGDSVEYKAVTRWGWMTDKGDEIKICPI